MGRAIIRVDKFQYKRQQKQARKYESVRAFLKYIYLKLKYKKSLEFLIAYHQLGILVCYNKKRERKPSHLQILNKQTEK